MVEEPRRSEEARRLALDGAYLVDTGEPSGKDIPSHDFTEQEETALAAEISNAGPAVVAAWRSISPHEAREISRIGMEEARRLWADAHAAPAKGNGEPPPEAR